jgi:hypothetical protein
VNGSANMLIRRLAICGAMVAGGLALETNKAWAQG